MRKIVLESPVDAEVTIQRKKYLYFGGTNYLGMAGRPEVVAAAKQAIDSFGLSSSASRTSTGTNQLHLDVESALSNFAGTEDAVLLSSGYLAMHSLLEGVVDNNDRLLLQGSAHPSIQQAVRLTGISFHEFDPKRLADLRPILKTDQRILVIVEGITSLTGDVFPLSDLLALLKQRDFLVLVDDAHGLGVVGASGKGTAELHHSESPDVISCATLSKAFGAFGGCILAQKEIGKSIRKRSLAYICASPPSAADLGAALAAIQLVATRAEILRQLRENVAFLKRGLRDLGLPVEENHVPIIPIQLGSSREMNQLSERLLDSGILAPHLTYPGSPEGGLIRLVVTATHTAEQMERLLQCLKREL
jgi:7-keto-8-aminopelargonate synthetase-like enzyme